MKCNMRDHISNCIDFKKKNIRSSHRIPGTFNNKRRYEMKYLCEENIIIM